MPHRPAAPSIVPSSTLLSDGGSGFDHKKARQMLDRLAQSAEETAQETAESWITAFDAALARGDERAFRALAPRYAARTRSTRAVGIV